METLELQKQANEIVDSIDKKLNVTHDETMILNHLMEEFGELARQHNDKNIRKIEQDQTNIEAEIADILIQLMKFATIRDINIEKAVINKIQKLKERHKL